jgi:hypothetical protein
MTMPTTSSTTPETIGQIAESAAKSALSTVEVAIKPELTWLQKHERLIIVFLVLLFCGWGINKYIDSDAKKADTQAQVALQQLADQKDKDTAVASQVAQLTAQYQQLVATVSQENAQLALAIQQRDAALQKQQTADQNLTPPQLATRWATLVGAPTGAITAPASGGLMVTDPVALDTVQQLEQVPVLTLNLTNETTEATADQQEVTKANALNAALTTQVGDLQKTVTDDATACKAQVAAVKADETKSKAHWFKFGFVAGFVSGIFTGHYL